jgi:hypothetical protein
VEDSSSSGGSECDEQNLNEITDEKKYFAEKLTF